jgi:hypothetical protein
MSPQPKSVADNDTYHSQQGSKHSEAKERPQEKDQGSSKESNYVKSSRGSKISYLYLYITKLFLLLLIYQSM